VKPARQQRYRVTLPPFPDNCAECGSKLDGSIDGPFAPWSVPVMDGATGVTKCSACSENVLEECETLPAASRELILNYRLCKGVVQ
jgi:hypothetical protein